MSLKLSEFDYHRPTLLGSLDPKSGSRGIIDTLKSVQERYEVVLLLCSRDGSSSLDTMILLWYTILDLENSVCSVLYSVTTNYISFVDYL